MICSMLAAEHGGGHGAGRDAHEQHMIQADAVKTVFQRQNALDLVRFDHRSEHVAYRECFLFIAREIIGER